MLPSRGRAELKRRHPPRAISCAFIAVGVVTLLGLLMLVMHLPLDRSLSPADDQLLDGIPSREFCSKPRLPLVCAHGGDTTNAPPNTMDAFKAALAAGVDCVEIDCAR